MTKEKKPGENEKEAGKHPDRLTTIEQPPYYAGKGHYELLAVIGIIPQYLTL